MIIIINCLQKQPRIFNQYLQCSEKLDSVSKHNQSSRAAELIRREWLDRKLKVELNCVGVCNFLFHSVTQCLFSLTHSILLLIWQLLINEIYSPPIRKHLTRAATWPPKNWWIKGNTFVSSEIREMKDNLHTSYVFWLDYQQLFGKKSRRIDWSETNHALPLF